jgi:integrase
MQKRRRFVRHFKLLQRSVLPVLQVRHACKQPIERHLSAETMQINSITTRRFVDQAIVVMLIGCGLRRAELLALQLASIQQREEHWVIADLVGKGGHVRTVPMALLGEEARRRVDSRGGHHARPGVPCDQQGRPSLGRRHAAEGARIQLAKLRGVLYRGETEGVPGGLA